MNHFNIRFIKYSPDSYTLALEKAKKLSTGEDSPVLFLSKYNKLIFRGNNCPVHFHNNIWDWQKLAGHNFSHIVFHEFGGSDNIISLDSMFYELIVRTGRNNKDKDYEIIYYLPQDLFEIPGFICKIYIDELEKRSVKERQETTRAIRERNRVNSECCDSSSKNEEKELEALMRDYFITVYDYLNRLLKPEYALTTLLQDNLNVDQYLSKIQENIDDLARIYLGVDNLNEIKERIKKE